MQWVSKVILVILYMFPLFNVIVIKKSIWVRDEGWDGKINHNFKLFKCTKLKEKIFYSNIFVYHLPSLISLHILHILSFSWGFASLVAWSVKNLLAVQETQVWSLGQENPLEKEMATYSSILAWEIPWTEVPGDLQSKGSQRVGHDWATNTFTFPGLKCA